LDNNLLTSIPQEIKQLENLQLLTLTGNSIRKSEQVVIRNLLPACDIEF
jgi:Leucine-rich repeat (LRR) protein